MIYKDLQHYIKDLDAKHQIHRIPVEVDSDLEVTEIADRVSKAYGPGLIFEQVKGSPYPLAINLMGTFERLAMGFGVEKLDDIAEEIENFMDMSRYATWPKKVMALPKLAPLAFIFPKKVKHAPCQEVVEAPDLGTLPILKCWPEDGGRYITLPLVFTKDPENGQQNVGMYRLQVYDHKTTGMHWHLHKDGRDIYEKYRKLGKTMPVSVALGCDPATIYAATAPMPKMIDEMLFAGYLKKRPVELVKSVTNDIYVPAHAEFILEGYVDLDERRLEGPFGDHTGYYSLADDYPVFHLEKITHKKSPVYPTTIVGKPPMEDCYLGKATERIFLPLVKIQCPEVMDMDFPLEGVFHNCAIVSIKKTFPKHGNKTLYALWGMGQMMYTKMIIIVDETVNVHDYKAVARAMDKNVTEAGHLLITEGPLDVLDHASDKAFQGYRLGVDATTKMASEAKHPVYPYAHKAMANKNDQLRQRLEDLSPAITLTYPLASAAEKLMVLSMEKTATLRGKDVLEALCEMDCLQGTRLVILLDKQVDASNLPTVAWKVFNNIDPHRDMVIKAYDDGRMFVGIDATKKDPLDGLERPWPADIEMSSDIQEKVSKRWSDYGFN